MVYIDTRTLAYPLGEWEIKQANKNISFPIPFVPLADYAPVHPTEQPAFDRFTQKAIEIAPVQVAGQWQQAWEVVALTPEEKKALVPTSVTRRQAKQALLLNGLLSNVQPAIDAIPDPTQRSMIQIEWDDSQTFERNRPALIALGSALGLDSDALDGLFIQASQL